MTQRIIENCSNVNCISREAQLQETDLDCIMNVPNYIYLEEHYPSESYDLPPLAMSMTFFTSLSQSRPFKPMMHCLHEEVKDEGLKHKPHPMIGNFMRKSNDILMSEDQDENRDPNKLVA